jgi:type II secretory pathway component PulF
VAVWAALAAVLVFVVPRYQHAYQNRGMSLPVGTGWAVAPGRWAEGFGYMLPLLALLILPVVVLVSWLLRLRARRSLLGWLWFRALLGIPVLLHLDICWAMLLP